MIPHAQLALASKLTDPQDQIYGSEALKERRKTVENKPLSYQRIHQ